MRTCIPPRWSVYILRCGDGTLYTGIATDVAKRFAEHRDGSRRSAKYVRGRNPLRLVLVKSVGSKRLALRVERRIKDLSRSRKEALLEEVEAFRCIWKQAKDSLRKPQARPRTGFPG